MRFTEVNKNDDYYSDKFINLIPQNKIKSENLQKMKNIPAIKLNLMPSERKFLRSNKIKIRDILKYSVEELTRLLRVSPIRAMELHALVEFQCIPSIGLKFAQDLISLGYYSLDELKDKDSAKILDELELSTGTWIDPCVEDQCRLVVHFANEKDRGLNWWDFTEERKKYRLEHGYPANRPQKAWFEHEKYQKTEFKK